MGTNWFMPAFVNRRFGESGMRLDDGTMLCCFDLKKSRNDWRIWLLVIIGKCGRARLRRAHSSVTARQSLALPKDGNALESVPTESRGIYGTTYSNASRSFAQGRKLG